MDRRSLLKALAAAGAVSLIPHDAFAAWDRIAAGHRPATGLTDAQLALVGAIADALLPRTDTPSATDVGVPAFVDVIVSEYLADDERAAFVANLDALDPTRIERIEAQADRRAEPARTYWRLKDLIVHGYFTSRPVMENVLHVEIMPGAFDGAAPMPTPRQRSTNG
jgi:hypothetical protein